MSISLTIGNFLSINSANGICLDLTKIDKNKMTPMEDISGTNPKPPVKYAKEL